MTIDPDLKWIDSARQRVERQRPATSFHEAGHAVSAYWLKLALGTTSISPTFLTAGSCSFTTRMSSADLVEAAAATLLAQPLAFRIRNRLERIIISTLAGAACERRALDEGLVTLDPVPDDAGEAAKQLRDLRIEQFAVEAAARRTGEATPYSDVQRVRDLLDVVADPEEAVAYAIWLEHRTRVLVHLDGFWRAVLAVAAALEKHETLGARATHKIIRAALIPTPTRLPAGDGYFSETEGFVQTNERSQHGNDHA